MCSLTHIYDDGMMSIFVEIQGTALSKSLPRDTKVLDMFPVEVKVAEQIYWFQLPHMGPLGESGTDYSATKISSHKADGALIQAKPVVEIFSVGRLGGLTGGLLNMSDFRTAMDSKAVAAIVETSCESNIERKRTDF